MSKLRLALYDNNRLAVVQGDDDFVDVTDALPWPWDPDPLSAGWWRLLCRDLDELTPTLLEAAETGPRLRLADVTLRAPVLSPSKILACASNYSAHVSEMRDVQMRTLGQVHPWMLKFDVFLKSPSSVSGPQDPILLPHSEVAAGHEIHHEAELVVVVGKGGKDLTVDDALSCVAGYMAGIDVSVRSEADRSRRKSYDTFSPVGPWLTTSDVVDPDDLEITLARNGHVRQQVNTRDLLRSVPEIISVASSLMPLVPGDLIFTGAPPGVGAITTGDELTMAISSLGRMDLTVV